LGRRRRRHRSGVAALERDAGPKNSQRNSCATSLPRRPRDRSKRAFGTRHRIDVDANMDHRPLLRLNLATFAALPATALAHHEVDASGSSFESWLIVLLAASAIGYGWGVARLWRKAGVGRGIRMREVLRFAAGWTALAAALLSPIDGLAERSFAVHMIQHEMLMIVAAPLLVLSRPL